jgi:hypothetical protein
MRLPTSIELDTLRLTGDALADEVALQMMQDSQRSELFRKVWAIPHNEAIEQIEGLPAFLKTYLQSIPQTISPTDMAQIQYAQAFFADHAQVYLGMLGLLSLPYCYAGEYGAQVLYLSARMQDNTEKRLLETTKFVLDVLSPDSFLPAGKAWVSIAQVRLLHAIIRLRVQNLPTWDMKWGLPINQEDMLGTNFAFSWIVLRGMEKIGYLVTAQDRQALLDTWRIIGVGLGIVPEVMPQTPKEAFWLDKTIVNRHFRASEVGKNLTQSLVSYLNQRFSQGLAETYMRYLLTDKIADYLGLAPADWRKNMVRLQTFYTSLSHYLPYLPALPTDMLLGDNTTFLARLREHMEKEQVSFAQGA